MQKGFQTAMVVLMLPEQFTIVLQKKNCVSGYNNRLVAERELLRRLKTGVIMRGIGMKYEDIISRNTYPNGDSFAVVKPLYRMIGTYKPESGGFLVNGCRKPSSTEDEAIKKILVKRLKEIKKEDQLLRELLAR